MLAQNKIRLIVAITIGYNVIEAIIAIAAGSVASSTALIGFGLDSTIEVASAAIVAWQFSRKNPQAHEKSALRGIGVAFFALAAYVATTSTLSLIGLTHPDHSTVGIVLTVASIIIMPILSTAERQAAQAAGSASAAADSKQTMMCTYLSAAVLLGLILNSTLGWWFADPIAGLVIAAMAVTEGVRAWKGESCCAPQLNGSQTQIEDCTCNDPSITTPCVVC